MSNLPPPFGSSLLDQSKAHPGNIDLSIFQPKAKPVGQGTTSSDYLQKTREDNPEPETDDKAKSKVQLSNCKFETTADQLVVSEPFEMSCEVKATTSEESAKLRVTFRLFVSYENDKGATVKEDLKANWDGFMQAQTGSQTVKAKGMLCRPNAPLGTTLQYKLVAEHMECPDKAESPVVEVVAKLQIQAESLSSEQFLSDGIVPLLHTDEKLPAILAQAIGAAMAKGPVGEEGTLLIQGHLPSGTKDGVDRSDLRARMVKSLLEKDANSWATLAVMHGTESEFIQNLSALAKLGWDCDPSAGKEAAHAGFKQEVKARYGLAIQEPTIGAASWKALHRSLLEGVQIKLGEDASKPPAWKIPKLNSATNGVFGWGSSAPAAGGPAGRTVDLCLYYGKNPGILPVTLGTQPTLAKNCLEDPTKVSKISMPAAKGGGKGTVGAEKKTPGKIDLKKMVEHANSKATKETQGICAKRVREAIEAGGGSTKGHPFYAKDYGPLLVSLGFEEVSDVGYLPMFGDVAVFLPPTTSKIQAGHIQIFNGTKWVSDFLQGKDFWPGGGYRTEKVKHWFYRLADPSSNQK